MEHKHFAVPTETLNKIMNLLSTLPYQQVTQLMKEIETTARPVTVNEPIPEEVK